MWVSNIFYFTPNPLGDAPNLTVRIFLQVGTTAPVLYLVQGLQNVTFFFENLGKHREFVHALATGQLDLFTWFSEGTSG